MSWTSLEGEVNNLISFFKKPITSSFYPDKFNGNRDFLINEINDENWNKSKRNGNLTYSFDVLDQAGNRAAGFEEVHFQINPQQLQQDENFAINITPTQDAVVSEHNGIIFRDLTIAGTTGVHPLRGTGGVTKDGKAIGGAPNAISGYKQFLILRNFIRSYAIFKSANEPKSREFHLVFNNRKDKERLLVEPVKFSLKKDGSKGPLYMYSGTFKVIGNVGFLFADKKPEGFLADLDEATESINEFLTLSRGVLLNSAALLGQVEREINTTFFEPLRQFDLAIKTLAGIGTQLADSSDNLIAKFSSSTTLKFLQDARDAGFESEVPQNIEAVSTFGGATILALDESVLLGTNMEESDLPDDLAEEFADEKLSSTELPRKFYEDFRTETLRIRDNAADSFGLGDPVYNDFANRTTTFVPSPTKQTTSEELEILFAFEQLVSATNLMLAYGGDQFAKSLDESFEEAVDNYNGNISLPVPVSVNEIIIAPGQTLEDIAFQQLEDIDRWIEIAKLNNLKPPYIAKTSTDPRIKKVNDRLFIPNDQPPLESEIRVVKENRFNKNLNETERKLGIDIKLGDNFDFVTNNQNDFELITGGANAGQAIRIKLNLEKGDLKRHKDIGLGLIVGEKNVNPDLIFDEFSTAVLQDPRFDEIKTFDLSVEGNTIVITMNLLVVESSTPVPLTIKL